MNIIFESPDARAFELRVVIERRVRQAFRRLDWLTSRIRVNLSGINDPQGGIDKCCRIELTTTYGSPVVVTSLAKDWLVALQSALARACKSLLHKADHSAEHSPQHAMPGSIPSYNGHKRPLVIG